MSTTTASTTFDLAALRTAIETRDAAGYLALYAPDAEITTVDENARPSKPSILRGHGEIGPFLDDVCSRDMTHRVTRAFTSGNQLAYEVECGYPDGTQVLCTAVAELSAGRIVSERGVQVWDV